MILTAALLLWLTPLLALPLAWRWTLRHPRLRPAMRNAVASGLAAASLTVLVMDLAAIRWLLQRGDAMHLLAAWPQASLSLSATVCAALAGWAACTLWLAYRNWLRGAWLGPACPTPMAVAIAVCCVLGLAVAFTEVLRYLAAEVEAGRIGPPPPPA